MNAARKSATIYNLHADRKSHALALESGRVIRTTYFTSTARTHSVLNTRSVHPHTAVPNVIKLMQENRHSAMWAEVWNDQTSTLLVTVSRNVLGDVDVMRYVDPVTGEELRPQPFKNKQVKTKLDTEIVAKLHDIVHELFLFEQHPASAVFFDKPDAHHIGHGSLSAILDSVMNEDYRLQVGRLRAAISETLLDENFRLIEERAEYIRKSSSYVFNQGPVERDNGKWYVRCALGVLRSR